MDLQRLRNWLRRLGMDFVGDPEGGDAGFHSSGHASGPGLLEVIRTIRPRIPISIHTEKSEYFVDNLAGDGIEVGVPRVGQDTVLAS